MNAIVPKKTTREGLKAECQRLQRIIDQAQAHSGDSPQRQVQMLIDSLAHMRPDPPYTHITDAGDPELSPDWNHDGTYGDAREQTPGGGPGDYDVDIDSAHDTAYFRYPCMNQSDGWLLHYVSTGGTCNGRSFFGRPRIELRNPIGFGVCVTVTSPAVWTAAINSPHAIPTDSIT